METKFWYSVRNDGDGSAYPVFMESKALCEIDQYFMEEGWGESCIGFKIIVSNEPVTMKYIKTVDSEIEELKEHAEIGDIYNSIKREVLKKLKAGEPYNLHDYL